MPKTSKVGKRVRRVGTKTAAKPRGGAPRLPTPALVKLRTAGGEAGTAALGPEAARTAMALSYIVRNRRRWADREETLSVQSADTEQMLKQGLEISEATLRDIASAGRVEVEVPFVAEDQGWEGRIMPWEYALSGATRLYRYNRPLTVTRRLLRSGATPMPLVEPSRLLFVETAPGDLREGYTFDYERKLVQEGLGPNVEVHIAYDPTREQLEEAVRSLAPDIIHITGFDNHQGLTLLGRPQDPDRRDGILLRKKDNSPDPVFEQDIARLLTCAHEKPSLVSLNLFNSAARTAALAVANGANAAIGFQDEFADPLAELFFATFYRAWSKFEWQAHRAFSEALRQLRATPDGLQGTGIALWTAYSAFDEQPVAKRRHRASLVTTKGKAAAAAGKGPTTVANAVSTSGDVEVRVEPFTELNYSMLHNNSELFDVFLLRNFTPDKGHQIDVEVTLFVGTESYPCENSFTLNEAVRDLSSTIHVPLISILGRSVREAMRTSLRVKVVCDGIVRHCKTYPVTLLPIDEWRDDDDNRHWLPSFVLPRDPVIPRIVDAAQRYLMALTDDPTAGFDGYQSIDLTKPKTFAAVDSQVQAIWSALLYELPLAYINPPPTFTESSQRLRPPSDVINGRRGTCIDLALLLASCLEYVDIYPVIFLFDGHCFPGYWRTHDAHDRFERVRTPDAVRNARPSALREITGGQLYAWLFDTSVKKEIEECVNSGDLVLVETVSLTKRLGFRQAVRDGKARLKADGFQAMMDVLLARERDVTPLPMIVGETR